MTLKILFEKLINYDITVLLNLMPVFIGGIIWYWIGKKYSKNRKVFVRWYAGVYIFLLMSFGGLRDLAKLSLVDNFRIIIPVYIGLAYVINLLVNKACPVEDKPAGKKKANTKSL